LPDICFRRREQLRRIGEAAPAVQQPGDRVGEQRAAGQRPRHEIRLRDERRRQQVDEILREAPDRGRVAEQLVRVDVNAAVVAVAVVEVPVDHQHFKPLQVLERTAADVVGSAHCGSIPSGVTSCVPTFRTT
jgi:hypothetical protein